MNLNKPFSKKAPKHKIIVIVLDRHHKILSGETLDMHAA